jgi:UDP-glucose 4-epimerase
MATLGVTGAAGFVGGALVPELARRGYSLVLWDNFSGPVRAQHRGWPVRRADIRDPRTLAGLHSCDAVLHLAAASDVLACAADPDGTYVVNVSATRRLVADCGRRGIPVALASSLNVVGAPARLPITETTPTQPTHAYAAQKAEAEAIVRGLAGRDGPGGAILRMSNVYGRYRISGRLMAKANVLNVFAAQCRAGVLRVHAPGTQRRDYVHLEDAVAHWAAVAARLLSGDGRTEVPTFNVASGETATVLELAERVRSHWARLFPERPGLELTIVPNPRGELDIVHSRYAVDRSWTEARLGLACQRTLEDSIDAILQDEMTSPARFAAPMGVRA